MLYSRCYGFPCLCYITCYIAVPSPILCLNVHLAGSPRDARAQTPAASARCKGWIRRPGGWTGGGLGPWLPLWAQSGQQTRFSVPSCKDVRNPILHCWTSFLHPASLICCARAESAISGVLPGRPGALFHQGPGQGRENRAREWSWPGLEMSRQGQTGPAEQVYLRAQGLNPTSSGSYLRSHTACTRAFPLGFGACGKEAGRWPRVKRSQPVKPATLSKFT